MVIFYAQDFQIRHGFQNSPADIGPPVVTGKQYQPVITIICFTRLFRIPCRRTADRQHKHYICQFAFNSGSAILCDPKLRRYRQCRTASHHRDGNSSSRRDLVVRPRPARTKRFRAVSIVNSSASEDVIEHLPPLPHANNAQPCRLNLSIISFISSYVISKYSAIHVRHFIRSICGWMSFLLSPMSFLDSFSLPQ